MGWLLCPRLREELLRLIDRFARNPVEQNTLIVTVTVSHRQQLECQRRFRHRLLFCTEFNHGLTDDAADFVFTTSSPRRHPSRPAAG